jgi:hypothetical protein
MTQVAGLALPAALILLNSTLCLFSFQACTCRAAQLLASVCFNQQRVMFNMPCWCDFTWQHPWFAWHSDATTKGAAAKLCS